MLIPGERAISREQAFVILERLAWAMNPDLFDHIAVDWSLTSMRKGWMAVDPPFDIARLGTRRDEQTSPDPRGAARTSGLWG